MEGTLQALLLFAQLHLAAALRLEQAAMVKSPFNNVLLVVHCRLKVFDIDRPAVCAEREPLYEGYKKYFGEVYYLPYTHCEAGDPHVCLATLMKGPGAKRDGLFYMHFDALIRPRHLGATFNVTQMYAFNQRTWCEINKETLGQEHCVCSWWGPRRAIGYQRAIEQLRNSSEPAFKSLSPWEFWIGNDDMFYMPRSLYKLYDPLANAFSTVHHEIGGPSMRAILERITSVPQVNMACSGGCCKQLKSEVALRADFRCGHAFDLANDQTRGVFPTAISTYRDATFLETWRQVMKQALA